MKHLIEIDDKTQIGKSILNIIATLAEKSKAVVFKTKNNDELIEEIEETDDPQLLSKMLEARKSGYVNNEKMNQLLRDVLDK